MVKVAADSPKQQAEKCRSLYRVEGNTDLGDN